MCWSSAITIFLTYLVSYVLFWTEESKDYKFEVWSFESSGFGVRSSRTSLGDTGWSLNLIFVLTLFSRVEPLCKCFESSCLEVAWWPVKGRIKFSSQLLDYNDFLSKRLIINCEPWPVLLSVNSSYPSINWTMLLQSSSPRPIFCKDSS